MTSVAAAESAGVGLTSTTRAPTLAAHWAALMLSSTTIASLGSTPASAKTRRSIQAQLV